MLSSTSYLTVDIRLSSDDMSELVKLKNVSLGVRNGFFSKQNRLLDDICLSVFPGDKLALLGRNGSGKSSMLKLIAGVYEPTGGEIVKNTESISLLTLGSGFEAHLTGWDNVYLVGALLGVPKKKIDQEIDSIIEYAEIGPAIHKQIKTYSSGMLTRLAFAISTLLQAKLFLIDEVLSVGDESFQKKSRRTLLDKLSGDQAFILVSHDLNLICDICNKAVLIEYGQIVFSGTPESVVSKYRNIL